MQLVNDSFTANLQEIVDLRTEIKLQEEKYSLLLQADEPFSVLRDIRLKIKYLCTVLTAKEEHIKNLSH